MQKILLVFSIIFVAFSVRGSYLQIQSVSYIFWVKCYWRDVVIGQLSLFYTFAAKIADFFCFIFFSHCGFSKNYFDFAGYCLSMPSVACYLPRIIFSEIRSSIVPNTFFKIGSGIPKATLAPSRPPTKKPRHIKAAIFRSTAPCL